MSEGDDGADQPSVAVALMPVHDHLLSTDIFREVQARSIGERLSLLRRVYACKPDPVLLIRGIEHRDRVAVGNADGESA